MTTPLRSTFGCILMTVLFASPGSAAHVESTRYTPDQAGLGTEVLFAGESTLLEWIELSHHRLAARERSEGASAEEQLYLVLAGRVSIEIGTTEARELGPGSVALILPGQAHAITPVGGAPAVCYRMRYRLKAGGDAKRGEAAGGSFMVDFETLEFRPHDKGGLRAYYDRPTTMTNNFEMHVTTLNEGVTSHPPHTHGAEEIILMIHGEAEELIDGAPHRLKAGELVFLDSMVPHGIRNTGQGTCMYFAFQWR